MSRSRKEIISEMVDSGLFTDDEIRTAAAKSKPSLSLPAKATEVLTDNSVRSPASSVSQFVKRVGRDTLEALPLPTSREATERLMSPMPGQFGPSRTMQDVGERFPSIQELTGDLAEKASESKMGQLMPIPTAALGSAAYAASHMLPEKLTPSEAALSIGAEGLPIAAKKIEPLVKMAGRGVARGAEGISGLEYKTPGVLAEAANDPTLISGPGKKTAGVAYEAIEKAEGVRNSIGTATTSQKVIDEGLKAVKKGNITHAEALVVRQAIDKSKNSLPKFTFNNLRKMFDDVAKKATASADEGYKRAVKSEALRLLLPVNKSGGTSIAKGFLGTLAGIAPALAMSPVVQGGAATMAGIGGRQAFGRTIPGLRAALTNILKNHKGKQNGR